MHSVQRAKGCAVVSCNLYIFFFSPLRMRPQTPSPGRSDSPSVALEAHVGPEQKTSEASRRGKPKRLKSRQADLHLQINGPNRPMDGEQRSWDQCEGEGAEAALHPRPQVGQREMEVGRGMRSLLPLLVSGSAASGSH